MNYIYDIYLNFENIPYDFFEWNKSDKLTHLKKIPIIKLDLDTFKKIVSNKINIEQSFLNKIKFKTEIWKEKHSIKYCCLFCSDSSIIAVKFNDNGTSDKKSFLYIDEEMEILNSIHNLKHNKLNVSILNKDTYNLKTRHQLFVEKFINDELNKISDDKLKYVYFECFNKNNEKCKMLNDLKKLKFNDKEYKNLYNILKIISTIKK